MSPGSRYEDSVPNRWVTAIDGSTDPCAIGIISDVHQNTAFLEEVLEEYRAANVHIVFALGDYSYTEKPDEDLTRARQFERAVQALADWLSESEKRFLVFLLGNHELEEWYYKDFRTNLSRRYIWARTAQLRRHPQIVMPPNPFASYECSNAIDLTLYFGERRRSFRLVHAVSGEFVESLYRGLSEAELEKQSAKRGKIVSEIGESWLQTQLALAAERRARWNAFLASKPEAPERQRLVADIHRELRAGLSSHNMLKQIAQSKGIHAGDAAYYLSVIDDLDFTNAFWLPPMSDCPHGITSVAFRKDLCLLYQALGIGRMYSLCGHFHADIGMFDAAPDLGTYGIAVGGMQPGKLIGDNMSAYILSCSSKDGDHLMRLHKPPPANYSAATVDLSGEISLDEQIVLGVEEKVIAQYGQHAAIFGELIRHLLPSE